MDGQDVIIHSQTGSGKTLGYLLPLLASIDPSRSSIQGIVIVPTRELGVQVARVARRLAVGSVHANVDGSGRSGEKIMIMSALQGSGNKRQRAWARADPPHVVIGTPKELEQLVKKGGMKYHAVKFVVVDEVDACLLNNGGQVVASATGTGIVTGTGTGGSIASTKSMSGSLHELLSRYLSPTFEQANSWSDGGNGATQDWQRLMQMGDIQNVASDGTKKGVISHGTDRQTVFVSATIPQKNHFLKQCVQNQWTVREPFYVCASPGELIPPTLKHVYVVCDGMDQKMVGLVRAIHREVEKETVTTSDGSDCVVRMIVFCEPQRPMEKMQNVLQRELSRRMMVNSSAAAYSHVVTSVLRYDDSTSTRVAAMETFRGSDTYLGGRLIDDGGGDDMNADAKAHLHYGDSVTDTEKDTKSGDMITDIPSTSLKNKKELNILITSDLAARGLDIADITHVINYDLPRESDTYVHRGGRAGRLGRKGMVISIITNEQEFVLNRLANKLGLDMKCISRQQQRSSSSSTRKK